MRSLGAVVALALLCFGCNSDNSGNDGPSITGRISAQGGPLSGVTVKLSGANDATTTTDAAGNYQFLIAGNGTYSLNPSKAGYAFMPAARPVSVGDADSPGNDFLATTAPAPEAILLPQTGQTLAHRAGDDGDTRRGTAWPSPRFADNGDGTVTDRLTGLVWLKNADCYGTKDWASALAAANTLASGSCGLSDNSRAGDWRVPNVNELASLIAIASLFPALPVTPGSSLFVNLASSYYWSSSTSVERPYYAWMAYLDMGYVDQVSKADALFLWPVRDGRATAAATVRLPRTGQTYSHAVGDDGYWQKGAVWPEPRFTDNRDGTVRDNLTGLVWLRNANCLDETVATVSKIHARGLLQWGDALAWSNALASGACGLTDGSVGGDWALPNRAELASLTDRSQANPALPASHLFDNVGLDGFWSSSSLAPYPTDGKKDILWIVYQGDGRITVGQGSGYYDYFSVLPVRRRRNP